MFKKKDIVTCFIVIASIFLNINFVFAQTQELSKEDLNTQCNQECENQYIYPDYVYEFLGEDKFEIFNRKMFNFNMKMNKYALRPLHVVWASIMPKYGMDRIQGIYENALYPKRLISNLIQRDFEGVKDETIRFLTNSTLGFGGMFDPAKRCFGIESTDADMEQALAKCKVKSGPYLVCPILSSSSPRALVGRALDAALDPSSYVAIPFMSLVKLGFTINDTAYMQPMSYLLEATCADPYDIMRKLYAIQNYLKNSPPVEKEILQTTIEAFDGETQLAILNINPQYLQDTTENIIHVKDWFPHNYDTQEPKDYSTSVIKDELLAQNAEDTEVLSRASIGADLGENIEEDYQFSDYDEYFVLEILAMYAQEDGCSEEFIADFNDYENLVSHKDEADLSNSLADKKYCSKPVFEMSAFKKIAQNSLKADITLEGFNPQSPVVDAMRTALFDVPDVDDSAWSELSIWNRSFSSRIKTSSVELFEGREPYKFRFIMQKDKSAPVAIIYPSIGEGIMSHHSVIMAKIFYDKGYSVIIQGSHFQWEFVKSMPEDYRPGVPVRDVDYLKMLTTKIINTLQDRYNCEFSDKVVIGTSFGAMTTLFLAQKESKDNTLNISKFISINPPIELLYSMQQIDNNTAEWNKNPQNLKERVALTAAKVMQLLQDESLQKDKIEYLPFSEEEAKLITGFVMHQKLSDLIFTIEDGHNVNQSELYSKIRSMNYREYAKKYLLSETYNKVEDLGRDTSLYLISDYLKNSNNYKIYHAIDDYLVNHSQLQRLKSYCGNRLVLMNNGSHLGFLYRKEFIDLLKQDITRDETTTTELAERKI